MSGRKISLSSQRQRALPRRKIPPLRRKGSSQAEEIPSGQAEESSAQSLWPVGRKGDLWILPDSDTHVYTQEELSSLLTANGYPADALEDKPLCAKCGDTGWRGAQMCECLKKLCAQEQIQELSKLLDLGEQSFDAFRLDYYSDQLWPGRASSPRTNMDLVYEVCLNYAQKFGRFHFKNLFLTGAPGLGKTFLSACIARSVSEQGFSVVYDTAGNIFAQFENRKFQRDAEGVQTARDETRRYLNCDLLILDDLGSELTTQFTQSALYELINTRLVSDRRTVISSNLTPEDVVRRYTPQISSRLLGEFYILHFFGDDIRLLKRK